MIKDKIDNTDEILFNMRQALLKLLPLTTIIVFSGLCALAPLYITMGIMTRQMTEKTNP
tara:strand:- start:8946 stop:9122 length:177 start_codon:yes stop_codon:yes gene_type:complete